MGLEVAIATINAIAPTASEFPGDGATVPAHLPGDLRQIKALLYQL